MRGDELGILPGGRARRVRLEPRTDERGSLLPVEFASLPFEPRRVFVVNGVPVGGVRGGHSHRRGQQLLICVSGSVDVELRDNGSVERVTLDRAGGGLLVEAGVWAEQTYLEAGSVLLVFASEPYDADSYERDDAIAS
jgi:dTDP-4-dehydrorhamnose 3,5-epimerase-like enzyme